MSRPVGGIRLSVVSCHLRLSQTQCFQRFAVRVGHGETRRYDLPRDDRGMRTPLIAQQAGADGTCVTALSDGRSIAEAARSAGLHPQTVRNRLDAGWTEADALGTPARAKRPDRPELRAEARAVGLNPRTVRARIDEYGWSEADALARPVRSTPIVLSDGRMLTDAAREAGLLPRTVRSRLLEGWSEEKALSAPARRKRL